MRSYYTTGLFGVINRPKLDMNGCSLGVLVGESRQWWGIFSVFNKGRVGANLQFVASLNDNPHLDI